jgi:hypothetical protein
VVQGTSFVWKRSVGMFKAEIKEDALFSAARPHSERNGDTWNNWEPIFKVVHPANSGAQQEIAGPVGAFRNNHLLTTIEDGLQ